MKKLIYIVSIDHYQSRIKCSSYSDYCFNTWKYWCNKHEVDFIVETSGKSEFGKAMWNKTLIKDLGKTYDKIGIIDVDTMIKWDTPNIFEMYEDEFCGVVDTSDYNWILNNINVYNKFFPNIKLNVDKYINSGVMFFTNKHLYLFEQLQNFYFSNKNEIDNLNESGGGKDQTLINYHLTKNNVKLSLFSPAFNLISMHKKDMFKNNWQLNRDQIPHFIKYGKIWHFTGFGSEHKENLMKQTWESTKHLYK